ncbi:MAG: toll/interleukin-1 receptor domain-containing protein [Thermoanaerobaculia bacterium]|nr:toll/interleukin-1 receptor domain-containing protein [Thermoanaerobaculia bacterium]
MREDTPAIYISRDESDASTAGDVQRYLQQTFGGQKILFWDGGSVAEEQYRTTATLFLENCHLFIACLSINYTDSPDVRWELEKALQEQKRRPGFQIAVLLARGTAIPENLSGFPIVPSPGQPVEGFSLSREIQLQRSAQGIRDILYQIDRSGTPAPPTEPEYRITFEDVRERLLVGSEHCDLIPVFNFLKQLLHPEKTPDDVFQLEDAFAEWRQQTQRNKLGFDVFSQTIAAIRLDLQHDQTAGLFLPAGEILIPDSLNLVNVTQSAPEQPHPERLTLTQQQEFRRKLLLAQDDIGIGNFSRAHTHCEHVRGHIDPQSAQLYEMLLITYLKKETPDRIIHDAVYGSGYKLNHVIVFAGRLADYQRNGKCPAEAGFYNLRAAAQALSDALLRLYSQFQNDYILHTGRYGREVPDNRAAIARCIQIAMEIYRTVHPYRGFLELVVNELCNGGKYDYIRQVEIANDEFRFASHVDFGLESEIREVVGMMEAVSPDDDDALMNRQLRENLLFNLKAKRVRLQAQVAEERRRYRTFTDVRDSVIELVQAALLGYKIFSDQGYPDEESFLRLAVEQLLPGLLLPTASGAPAQAIAGMRWFDLDANGAVRAHPDCARYEFDALEIVEKIVRDHAGSAGWLQVHPNIKQEVFLQFVADTNAEYQRIYENLQWTDIRRMHETEARRRIIQCLRNWKIAYLAYPDTGTEYLQHILQELTGNRLLLWMRFSPPHLTTLPDSAGLGYNALAEFKQLLELPGGIPEEDIYRLLAYNLFHRHIRPSADTIPAGDESKRQEMISLLLQALQNYRDLYPAPEYLDFVFDELTLEHRYRWVDVMETGVWQSWPFDNKPTFSPTEILEQLAQILPERYHMLEARQRIAQRRHADLQNRYLREISEYPHENRLIEREIAIGIMRKLKGLFLFYPDAAFLTLPLRELEGYGRIKWYEDLLGVFPSRKNHYENQLFRFDYRQELSEFRMYRDTVPQWMEHVKQGLGTQD